MADTFRRIDAEFGSGSDTLRGWFYQPGAGSDACVIMAHGFSAVKEQYLDLYAAVFAAAGLNVLLFDHACFGASDGGPRSEVDPARQRDGYAAAAAWVRMTHGIEPHRIGLWGSSYSGGHVLAVAAILRTLGAVVAQVPTISGSIAASRRLSPDAFERLRLAAEADREARAQGMEPEMIDVTTDTPGQPCALPGADSHAFFHGSRSFAPNWRPKVTLQSTVMARTNDPGAAIEAISPVPLLMIVASEDLLTPTDLAINAFGRAGEPKRLEIIEGGHFTPYIEHFERTSSLARDWFVSYLLTGSR